MRTKIFFSVWLILLLVLSATPVYAVPALPHAFYGTVTINDETAPVGTEISASGTGVTTDIAQNPLTTTVVGQYGNGGLYLLVQGDITDGTTITFYVNGTSTGQTAEWHSGQTTELNLTVTIAAPSGDGGGGGVAPPVLTTISLTGLTATVPLRVNAQGIVQASTTLTTADGKLSLYIAAGTKILDVQGNPLASLTAVLATTPPSPPPTGAIVLAYNLDPDGATFVPPLTLTIEYDPADIPEDVAEEDLVIAYWDGTEWVVLDSVVDAENDTITAAVEHFTTFAIIGTVPPPPPPPPPVLVPAAFTLSNLTVQPAEVQPKEAVTIAVSVANTGGTEGSYTVVLTINGVKEDEKSVTVVAGSSEIVTFSVSKEQAGSYSVTVDGLSGSFTVVAPAPPPPPEEEKVPEVKPAFNNWPLIGGIIAAVVVVGLIIFFLVRRKRAY